MPDCNAARQAKLAVESRTFPLFIYDPRKGEKIRERLSLVGNPAQKEDWWTPPQSDKPFTFVDFARTEGRFAKQFDRDGNPSEALLDATRSLAELACAARTSGAALTGRGEGALWQRRKCFSCRSIILAGRRRPSITR